MAEQKRSGGAGVSPAPGRTDGPPRSRRGHRGRLHTDEAERYPALVEMGVPPGRRVELPGRGWTWVREVPGPRGAATVILLHGLSATGGTNWAPAFAPLGRHYRVLALDHRGHGRGVRSRHFRLADCADDVVALADTLGIDDFVAVGYSMGGPIAQLVWHRHPARVSGLVLCATSRDFRGRLDDRAVFAGVGALNLALHGLPRRLGTSGWAGLARILAGNMSDPQLRQWSAEELARHDPRLVAEAALAVGAFSSRGWIDGMDKPVAVIATEDDQLVPLRRQVRMAEHIPSAVLHPIRGDHFAVTRQAEVFMEALVDSCREVTGRSNRWTLRVVTDPEA